MEDAVIALTRTNSAGALDVGPGPTHSSPSGIRKYLHPVSSSVSSGSAAEQAHTSRSTSSDVQVQPVVEKKRRTIFGSALSKDKDKEKDKDKDRDAGQANATSDTSNSRTNSPARKQSSAGSNSVENHISATSGHDNGANTSISGSKHSPTIGRRRSATNSVAVNTRASQLRDEIACKEYEVARLEKQINMSNSSQSTPSGHHHPTTPTVPSSSASPAPIIRKPSDLSTVALLADLVTEIGRMKEEYAQLTGKSYEMARETKKRRRIIRNYWRSSNNEKDKDSAITAGNTAVNAVSSYSQGQQYAQVSTNSPSRGTRVGLVDASGPFKPNGLFPAHWSEPVR
jgi:hypothetical protein